MADLNRLPPSPQVEDEAAEWVARRDSAPLDSVEESRFQMWLETSPVHRETFNRLEALWTEFDGLSSHPHGIDRTVASNDDNERRIGRRAFVAGIAVALAAGGGFFGYRRLQAPTYQTAIGEQRTITLADGSRIALNTDTSFRVAFSEGQRQIVMDHGEALFEVAHDPARPFTVISRAGSVRAVGTKFVVRLRDDSGLDVLVTEGKVLVARSTGSQQSVEPEPLAPVSAGQQLTSGSGAVQVAAVSNDQIVRDLAWRQGDIIFQGEPLAQAASELQRYTSDTLVVDRDVAGYSVGGYFRTNDINAFVQTVEAVFPVKAVRSPGQIRFMAKPA